MGTFYIIMLIISTVLIVPLGVFIGLRQAVKTQRQEIVRDLAAVFHLPHEKTSEISDTLIPSFEFVKYKYFLERADDNSTTSRDFSNKSWLIGLLPLSALLILFSIPLSLYISCKILSLSCYSEQLCFCAVLGDLIDKNNSYHFWVYGLIASFAGGYTFAIKSFFRAINNFDFSPSSFVGAANSIIIGIILSVLFANVIIFALSVLGSSDVASFYSILLVGFAIGYFPESATRTVLRRSELSNFKKENEDVYKSTLITPVEIIDGIDTEIRDRLADHHIRSTQNLAAANPLMLFVETPYGVYQIMDWVAQAQLCCSVGSDKLVRFWKLGIRTLFDLERAALDRKCRDDHMLIAIGRILFENNVILQSFENCDRNAIASRQLTDMVVSNIQIRLDDPHVQRLRQIYIRIGNRLGPTTKRFDESDYQRDDEESILSDDNSSEDEK